MQRSLAETLALRGLVFLAADGDALLRFLSVSGLTLEHLREHAGDPELLAGIMDFLLTDDRLLANFVVEENLDAQTVHAARRALPGAESLE